MVCISAVFFYSLATLPQIAAATSRGEYSPQFPSRSQWYSRTNKAIDAFAEIHKEPVSHVNHQALSQFTLTAYNLDVDSTGKRPGSRGFGITASGTHAQAGRTVAVDPKVIPIGTLLYLPGLGWRVAEDSGGAVKGRHIDILFKTRQEALSFGVKKHATIFIYY